MKSLLDLSGPQFLMVYASMLGLLIVAGFLIRWMLRGPFDDAPARILELDAYQTAYLNGGPSLAVASALASLASKKAVTVRQQRLKAEHVDFQSSAELETAVLSAVIGGYDTPRQITSHVRYALTQTARPLEQYELILSASSRALARWLPPVIGAVILLLGIAKICVGISRGRPVGFLIALCVVCAIVSALFCRPVRWTVRGERLYWRLRNQKLALAATARSSKNTLPPEDIAMAVALFGVASLGTAELYPVRRMLGSNGDGTSGPFGGCGSGSSCSGGSSCGGGGCGGGGCGGCGS